jgi:hypothetical protein
MLKLTSEQLRDAEVTTSIKGLEYADTFCGSVYYVGWLFFKINNNGGFLRIEAAYNQDHCHWHIYSVLDEDLQIENEGKDIPKETQQILKGLDNEDIICALDKTNWRKKVVDMLNDMID